MRNLLKAVLYGLDEALLVAAALVVLWKLGVDLSPLIIVAVIIVLGFLTYIRYKVIVSTAKRKPAGGHEGMMGLQGKVASPLIPEGTVKIRGELWKASCTDDSTSIEMEEEVVVIGVDRLKLLVKRKEDS